MAPGRATIDPSAAVRYRAVNSRRLSDLGRAGDPLLTEITIRCDQNIGVDVVEQQRGSLSARGSVSISSKGRIHFLRQQFYATSEQRTSSSTKGTLGDT
jgi:hypothetical protein